MRKTINVTVIYGGPSAEHEVSLNTGGNIIAALKKLNKYSVTPIKINKAGQWLKNDRRIDIEAALKGADVVFNALHGEFGEDGTLQGILDHLGIKYTGSGMKASMIGMDKVLTKILIAKHGIKSPNFVILREGDSLADIGLSFPMVVKPNSKGSSVGVSIVRNKKELVSALQNALIFDDCILVEEFIAGREITIGLLENYKNQKICALPITEIIPDRKFSFFDYEAKYTAGASQEITPAKLPAKKVKEIEKIAIEVFKSIGARHYARVDMIIDSCNNSYVLEINTLPGMTNTSLLPQQAKIMGLPLEKLLDHLLQLALSTK
jgi:D-alanine-D-alanine ligase